MCRRDSSSSCFSRLQPANAVANGTAARALSKSRLCIVFSSCSQLISLSCCKDWPATPAIFPTLTQSKLVHSTGHGKTSPEVRMVFHPQEFVAGIVHCLRCRFVFIQMAIETDH